MKTPDEFVTRMAALSFANAFNPYSDRCGVHDLEDADALRRANLRQALEACWRTGVDSLWVARDLGHRGGRRTGLALTDEAHLPRHAEMLGCPEFARATIGEAVAERTATVIWDELTRLKRSTFLWNVFPLHPHEPQNPLSNRSHRRHEAEAGAVFLRCLVDRLQPRHIVAIGRDAHVALVRLGFNATAIRHPSYGGEREFRSGIARHYGV